MKFLLAPLIVVAFIITSSSLVTAQQKNITCYIPNQATIVTTGEIIAKLTEDQCNQIKDELCEEFKKKLIHVTSQILKATSTALPTLTLQPTPQPEPQCAGTSEDNPATSCKEIHDCNPTAPSGDYWVHTTKGPVKELYCLAIACNGTESNPATSCKDIYDCSNFTARTDYYSTAPSGDYWIRNATGSAVQVFCEMETNNCGDITGGWMRVAYIDMLTNKTCPRGLTNTSEIIHKCPRLDGKRTCPDLIKLMCTRSHTDKYDCSSVPVQTHGVNYTKVCGQARGYQYRYTPAFRGSHYDGDGFRYDATLNDAYVSGLSVTYGNPPNRNHIWTFAAGWSKNHTYSTTNCPCAPNGPDPPPFVGDNYICESGSTGRVELGMRWRFDNTLWDTQDCAPEGDCCKRGSDPWFTVTLGKEVSDDIEVRLCHYFDSKTENIGVEELEIYIY